MANHIDVSIVIPACNEGKSIIDLLEMLKVNIGEINNEKVEIIIVDAKSSDLTVAKVKYWKKHNKDIDVNIIKLKERAYPGRARNIGVMNSKYNYIVFIDCGIVPENEWLKKLLIPFQDDKIDVVWGESSSLNKKNWEKIFSDVVEPIIKYQRFVRSSCIKKVLFNKVGGFREDLRSAEDLLYIQNIIEFRLNEVFVNAKAYYSGYPSSFLEAIRKWAIYTENDVYANTYYYKLKYSILEVSYFLLMTFLYFYNFTNIWLYLMLLIISISVRTWLGIRIKNKKRIDNVYNFLIGNIIAVCVDIGRIIGLIKGLIRKSKKKKEFKKC